ncbi:hypothetical protein Tco_0238045 [Tanacetum coccineum]
MKHLNKVSLIVSLDLSKVIITLQAKALDPSFGTQQVFRIQQYLQHEHYALWEVIEFGDSYKAPLVETGKGLAGEGSAKKKGKTVAITAEDMQKQKNDVKAITTQLLALLKHHLLGNQRLNKDKKSLGFNEYSVVPPPPAQVYSPPKKDLSWMGLPEFVDDTVTDYSRPTPSVDVLKDVSASSLEQGGSFDNVVSKPMIRFVKETGCPSVSKDNNTENPRKPTVKVMQRCTGTPHKSLKVRTKFPTVGPKVPTAKPTVAADKGNRGKAVKAPACWIWKPKQNQPNQGSNLNGVSVIFKKYKYIDTQGRHKSMMAWVPEEN